jgi:two-component system, OmpR family, sensor histidine kinase KdpD
MKRSSKPSKERILVCVSSSPLAAKLINSAKRIAAGLHAPWCAVYVEEPKKLILPEAERNRALDNLRLAERLGAETFYLQGRNIAGEIINLARQRNITKIVMGKPRRSRWKSILLRNPVDQLVRMSKEIDVYVLTGEPGEPREAPYSIRIAKIHWSDYGTGILYLILASALCFLMYPHFHLSNLMMVYLLGVVLTATGCGRGPAILVSLLSVLAFDFFFVPPRFSFTVEEAQYIVTFAVMLVVSLVISHLTTRMRQQAEIARLQERQATAMHGLSRELANTRGIQKILQVAVQYISGIFDSQVVALLPEGKGKLKVAAGNFSSVFHRDIVKEFKVARSAYKTGQIAGWGIQDSPGQRAISEKAEILYVPLQAANSTDQRVTSGLGVLALRPRDPERFLLAEQLRLIESLAKQVALALEVERLTKRKGNKSRKD